MATNGTKTPAVTETAQKLKSVIQTLYDLEQMARKFDTSTQDILFQKMNGLVTQFDGLEQMRPGLAHVQIPVDLVQHVDQGLNPDLYAQSILEQCQKTTDVARGKRVALEQLARDIEKEMQQ